ncbi:hypothetical protein SBRCBS47491_002105 [Sporothrix bragantina]|uniref:LysM domain-containing protein n=1 Tax=Sporothrix bragantina TaxID=671064 RepID=A0ABP0B435_9PEZI
MGIDRGPFTALNPSAVCPNLVAGTGYCVIGTVVTTTATTTNHITTATTNTHPASPTSTQPTVVDCTLSTAASEGDTCQSFALEWGVSATKFENPGLTCPGALVAGQSYCVVGTVVTVSVQPSKTTTTTTSPSTTVVWATGAPSPTQSGLAASCTNYYFVASSDSCSTHPYRPTGPPTDSALPRSGAHASVKDHGTDAPYLPLLSFDNPPLAAHPKFRYWLPDASVSADILGADIASLITAGAGGIELLPFYNYGQPPISTDWSVYGFGTPAFKDLFRAALNATARHKGVMDFALGANQGAGVPSPPPPSSAANATAFLEQGRGLAMELVYGVSDIGLNMSTSLVNIPPPDIHFRYEALQNFINAPELWGGSLLVAVLAVQVTGQTTERGGNYIFLNESSVVDLTDHVVNNTVSLTLSPSQHWQLMAFYQRYTNERSCVSVANASSWLGNGSWMVDHFSAAGAQKMTSFWDTHLLQDKYTQHLLSQVGEYSWEDSMEMMAALWWTPAFLDNFERRRGYSGRPVLPVLFQAANLWNGYSAPYNTTYAFSPETKDGGRYAEDYRLTLNEGYQEYLAHYQTWARSLGLAGHSCQPAYNLPLDMAADVPLVGAPELESLGFAESISNYRQFTGAAHLSGRNVVSTEIGAQRIGAYAQAVPALIKLFQDSFAAGVNILVIHGFPYSGTYPGTTWPGYTPFQYEFGEMWGPRQPAWRHINDTLRFAARNTLVLTTGVSRVDVAFLNWQVPFSARGTGPDTMMNAAGYTLDYIGGENLVAAVNNGATTGGVSGNVLGPDGPAYKVLIVMDQHKISPEASAALVTVAQAGLPLLFVGPPPNTTIGQRGQANVTANLGHLVNGSFSNVKTVSHADFSADWLATAAGIAPRIQVKAVTGLVSNASQLYTHWRADTTARKEFVYILNRGPRATFTLALETASQKAVPYILDTWTGSQTPLLVYSRSATNGRLVVNITLSEEESTILALVEESTEQASVVSHSPNVVRIDRLSDGRLEAVIANNTNASLQLSYGSTISLPGTLSNTSLTSMTLGPWNLSVEAFAAPDMLSTESVAANKTALTLPTPLATLVPWTQIPGLERVSGVGLYTTTFDVDQENNIVYTLHLTGRILHTLRVFVNGVPVPSFDPAKTGEPPSFRNGRDISALLKARQNILSIEVTTPLFNAVKDRQQDLRSVGLGTRVPRYYTDGAWADYGLVGEVVVHQWRRVVVA